jgi:hypothetical protein
VGSSVGSGIGVSVEAGRGVNVARATRVGRLVGVGSACERKGTLKVHAIKTANAETDKISIETMRFHWIGIKLPPLQSVRENENRVKRRAFAQG